ncbi:hypothetical protein F5883DRAFT_144808 [Diaporthe sp. PMI_573]|nr:hypothetical protein F5883DRAFT_144808 [Diaporthaceae sp. PMI_573]
MCSAINAKRDRVENYRTYTEALLQSFYKLKQTTRDHVDLVYSLTMGRQAPFTLDSYMGILRALEFLGTGISATDPKSLLIAFVYERNKPIFDVIQDFNPSKLECQATRSIWGFHELKVVTAKWMQGKDEDQMVRLGQFAMSLFDSDADTKPRYVSAKDRQFASKANLKRVWDRSRTQNSYIRLVRSLRLLGLVEKGGDHHLLGWLMEKTGLKVGQVVDHPWDLSHLELLVAKTVREGVRRSPGMQGATDTHEGGHTRNRETLEQVEKDVEDEDDEETEEVEEVVRADSPVRHDDPTALRLFQAVTEACETASNANNDVAKAYGALTWKSAELVAHLAKQGGHTGCPTVVPQKRRLDTGRPAVIPQKRRLEAPRQVSAPWIS